MELLASITVIALLLAVAVPFVAKVIDNARASQCASNLRQLYVGVQGFANDNGGRLPASAGRTDSDSHEWSGDWWFESIEPYLDEGAGWTRERGAADSTVFACPSGEPPDRWGGHYGMNAIVLPFRRPSESRVLRTAVREPSRTLLLGDSDTVYINSQFVDKGADAAHGTLAFRHRDRANVLYFDGHVEAVSRTQTADPEFRAELMGVDE